MLLESQYHQFKEDLNVSKPKGGIAFITDFEKKDMLAITHGHSAKPEESNQGKAIAMAPPPIAMVGNKPEEAELL